MKFRGCWLAGILQVLVTPTWPYEEKLPAPTADTNQTCIAENPAGPLPRLDRQYPYYGNTPDEMIPYTGVEPYYRYWITRLPFRGPGIEYPDPIDLKSLKVGLLSPPQYGPEGARGERTRKGVLLAFEEE